MQVQTEWRDAYTLSCIIIAALFMLTADAKAPLRLGATSPCCPGEPAIAEPTKWISSEGREVPEQHTELQRVLLATSSEGNGADGRLQQLGQRQYALRQLDLAVLMGGPALRPAVDAAIRRIQAHLLGNWCNTQRLFAPASPQWPYAGSDLPYAAVDPSVFCNEAAEVHARETNGSSSERTQQERPSDTAKRRRVPGPAAAFPASTAPAPSSPMVIGFAGGEALVQRCQAEVKLPPGSMGSSAVPCVELPSLERCASHLPPRQPQFFGAVGPHNYADPARRFLNDYMLAGDCGQPAVITGESPNVAVRICANIFTHLISTPCM